MKKQAYPKVIANLTTTSDVQLNFKEITLMLARSIAEFQNVLVIKNKRNIKLVALGFKGDATINLKHGDRCYIVANGKMLNLYNGEECTRTGWGGHQSRMPIKSLLQNPLTSTAERRRNTPAGVYG